MQTNSRRTIGTTDRRFRTVLVVVCMASLLSSMSPERTLAQEDIVEIEIEVEIQEEAIAEADDVVEEEAMLAEAMFEDGQSLEGLLLRYAKRETGFVRRACELTPEQVKQLKQIDANWIKEKLADKKRERRGNPILRGIGRFLGGVNAIDIAVDGDDSSARFKMIRTKIDAEIRSVLDDAQRETLAEEKRLRDEFRREATAAIMVSSIDRNVFLSSAQRTELIDAVAAWVGNKQLYRMFYLSNNQYIPDLPRTVLAKCLNNDQIAALMSMNRYNYEMDDFYMESNGMIQIVGFDDE